MARQWIPPRGFQKPWLRYSEGIRESVETNPLAMNNFLEVMRRPADPEIALRKHSEAKKPWQFSDISIMELTLGEIIDDFSIPPYANIHWPEGTRTYSKIGFTDSWRNREDWQLNRRPPMEPWEIPAVFPYEPQAVAPYPRGQPTAPTAPNYGDVIISWEINKASDGITWLWRLSLVIFNHTSKYNFTSGANVFSRIQFNPIPDWYAFCSTSDVSSYYNAGETSAGIKKGGFKVYYREHAGQIPSELWGISRLIDDTKNRLRVVISGTDITHDYDSITLDGCRTQFTNFKIDGTSLNIKGSGGLYQIYNITDDYDWYWGLWGRQNQLLLDEVLAGQWGGGYPGIYNKYYGDYISAWIENEGITNNWPSGEHSD